MSLERDNKHYYYIIQGEIMKMADKQSALDFFENVAQIIEKARSYIGRTADLTMCITYFEIGRMIVEEEQGGNARAEYGKGLLTTLSVYLSERVGKGFSESTLKNARKFYQIYEPTIRQAMLAESYPFSVSWTHYLILMRIKDSNARRFYEIESVNQQWTYRELKRQFDSSLYERLALSRDKDEIMRLALEGQKVEKPRDILKNPLVLDFFDLEENPLYSESDLESAIIANLQRFLLELGKGFLFEARQKRFVFNEKSFLSIWSVIIVFYNAMF